MQQIVLYSYMFLKDNGLYLLIKDCTVYVFEHFNKSVILKTTLNKIMFQFWKDFWGCLTLTKGVEADLEIGKGV